MPLLPPAAAPPRGPHPGAAARPRRPCGVRGGGGGRGLRAQRGRTRGGVHVAGGWGWRVRVGGWGEYGEVVHVACGWGWRVGLGMGWRSWGVTVMDGRDVDANAGAAAQQNKSGLIPVAIASRSTSMAASHLPCPTLGIAWRPAIITAVNTPCLDPIPAPPPPPLTHYRLRRGRATAAATAGSAPVPRGACRGGCARCTRGGRCTPCGHDCPCRRSG